MLSSAQQTNDSRNAGLHESLVHIGRSKTLHTPMLLVSPTTPKTPWCLVTFIPVFSICQVSMPCLLALISSAAWRSKAVPAVLTHLRSCCLLCQLAHELIMLLPR